MIFYNLRTFSNVIHENKILNKDVYNRDNEKSLQLFHLEKIKTNKKEKFINMHWNLEKKSLFYIFIRTLQVWNSDFME